MPPKRRRRFQGLYYHSSPPKVLPMNGQIANSNGHRTRGSDDFSVKLSTIRIWMHEKDIGKLTRVLWAGQGNRLRQQASTNAKVKRFLAAVPHVMNSIKDVHQAVIDNNLENLQANLEPPVPPALVTCRDANGLNLMHKAAGLGHATILEYLITTWPDGVHETDVTGKTPLHWAASAKNNMRCYTLLTQAGCDEEAVDYKMKTPSFYRHKPHEIERAFLTYVPEAPRVSPDVATDWDALSDDSGDGKKLDIKIPEMNGFGRHSNAESNENTSEAEMTEVASGQEDENDEPPAELENIQENPAGKAEEDAANEEENEDENEVTDNQDDEEPQIDENETKEKEVEETEADDEDEEMQSDKEEPPDEKQQTQTITQATANLTKESAEKDDIESKEPEHTSGKDRRSDLISAEEEHKDIDKETEKVEEALKALEGQKEVQDNGEEKTIEHIEDQDVVNNVESKKPEEDNMEALKEINGNAIEHIENKTEDEEQHSSLKDIEQNKINNDLQMSESKDKDEQETVAASNQKEEENNEVEELNEAKTLGETLVDIKDEVKDNIKYLADQVKNVFSGKDGEEETETEKLVNEESAVNKKESHEKQNDREDNKTEIETEVTTAEDQEEATSLRESLEKNEKVNLEKPSTSEKEVQDNHNHNEAQIEPHENHNANETQSETDENQQATETQNDQHDTFAKPENDTKTERLEQQTSASGDSAGHIEATKIENQAKTNTPATTRQLDNSSNDNFPFNTTTRHPAAPKTPKEASPKKEHEKTEDEDEDENNNNNNSEVLNEVTTNDDKTIPNETSSDNKFPEPNETSKEHEKAGENVSDEKDMSEKLKEMGDNLKDSVAQVADKVKHVFSANSESDKLDSESNEVVLHTENSAKKSIKEGESSDDANDEDEEQKIEAENEENIELKPELELEPELQFEQDPVAESPDATDAREMANKPKEEERDGEGSTTSSLAIEGFVQGEAEDNTVQSLTAAYVDDDEETRLQNIIAAGDMEQLAQIVLNGDGNQLLNVDATEPDIQAFLKNVPNYMNKIRRVHEAARSGSLLNLQQALDRRKFAVAKDEISPNGATPLHVAVLFGNSDIVRYLSARFPETTTITDNEQRTALHYAAVINDNGHFYNVLLQLGANPKVADNLGHTPEDYLNKEDLSSILSYSQLLKRFGAEDLEEQIFSDQGRIENQSIQENPLFKTEQGKYLADNLADPLIKALTQIAQKRPNDPLQYLSNYLQSYVTSRNTNGRTITQSAIHMASSQTNSAVSASSKQGTTADNIENDNLLQIDELVEDDGNDSDAATSKKLEERDEHGQSMLHFACARSHRKGGLIHLIQDAKADITYRDELYRTARDVALQANHVNNAKEIDRYVMSLAIVGDIKPFEHFALAGYDHIIDVIDDNETPIIEVLEARGLHELAAYLKTLRPLEELREELHQMIRDNNVHRVKEISDGPNGNWLIKARNYYGRTALHIAILKESVEIVEHFVNLCPAALKIGDNLERTPLHYAMGTNIIESISRVLIQNGAKRTNKDLKGRQPSYYFMNKADILRLQEEEDESR